MIAARLRPAVAADLPALAALYAACARTLGPCCYTPAQVAAWARFPDDGARFRDYVLGARTWVAEPSAGGAPLGFCGVTAGAEVQSLYVHPAAGRQGLGSRLLAHALAAARADGATRFTAWATPLSRPLFERAGLRLERVVREPFQGEMFDRLRMAG